MKDVFMEHVQVPPLRLTLLWAGSLLERVFLQWHDAPAALDGPLRPRQTCESEQNPILLSRLRDYVAGTPVVWPDLPLGCAHLPSFTRCVLETLRREVNWGETVSYGQLAALCGNPRAARAVGRAMACNPWPLLVPCHRVIGANGDLTGFTGGGLPMKKYLLRTEGVLPASDDA